MRRAEGTRPRTAVCCSYLEFKHERDYKRWEAENLDWSALALAKEDPNEHHHERHSDEESHDPSAYPQAFAKLILADRVLIVF